MQATRAGDVATDGPRRDLVVLELPSLKTLFNETHPEYPFYKTLSTSARDVAFIVHTSGSTGSFSLLQTELTETRLVLLAD
jgi:acyl-coenzyme A synthetase/AMP-(fatty) acid ligase